MAPLCAETSRGPLHDGPPGVALPGLRSGERIFQRKANFQRDLILDGAIFESAALLLHLKPFQVSQRLVRALDGLLNRVVVSNAGGADQLCFSIDGSWFRCHSDAP